MLKSDMDHIILLVLKTLNMIDIFEKSLKSDKNGVEYPIRNTLTFMKSNQTTMIE